MKKLATVFWGLVAVIALAFVMTIVTAVQKRNAEKAIDVSAIPTPAMPQEPGPGGVPAPKEPPSIPVPAEPAKPAK
ncbi:MAG: hypothetical protein NDJ89_06145 [Oligoflexia bacterium]|nr:hypothetical protein [Oligoflexia bacterium]